MDALRIGPGAVATLGLGVSQHQIARAACYPIRVICFDSDRPGKRRAHDVARQLSAFPGETHLVTLDAEDPASASDEEIQTLREEFLE